MVKQTGAELLEIMKAFYENNQRIDFVERTTYESTENGKLDWAEVKMEPTWNTDKYRYRVSPIKTIQVKLTFLNHVLEVLDEYRRFSREAENKIDSVDADDMKRGLQLIEDSINEIDSLEYIEFPDCEQIARVSATINSLIQNEEMQNT